jgi:hypothetical protein
MTLRSLSCLEDHFHDLAIITKTFISLYYVGIITLSLPFLIIVPVITMTKRSLS